MILLRKTVKRENPPMYPEHPMSEHKLRIDRARKIMVDDHLDVLLLSRNVTVFYATGSRFVFVGKDVPVGAAPQSSAIITPDDDIYCQRFGPHDSDAVALDTASSESIELYKDELQLVNIFRDYGVKKGDRIGVEWGSFPYTGIDPIKFQHLKSQVSSELGAEFVNGSTSIRKLMGIKSKLEVERMTKAVVASAIAMDRVYDIIEIGMNELEIAKKVSLFMLEEGGEAVTHCQVMSRGDGPAFASCNALDRPIKKGYTHLDIGCTVGRYGADINRGIMLGRKATPEEMQLHDCRTGINELMDKLIKPGVWMDEVIYKMDEFVKECGCELGRMAVGHQIGMENYISPNVALSATQPEWQNEEGKVLFQTGMMFTYEMPLSMPGLDASFNIEDDCVVTDTGVKNMNDMLSRELRVRL